LLITFLNIINQFDHSVFKFASSDGKTVLSYKKVHLDI